MRAWMCVLQRKKSRLCCSPLTLLDIIQQIDKREAPKEEEADAVISAKC